MSNKFLLMIVWLAVGIFGRLIPHWPDMTPLTALALLSTSVFSKRMALMMMVVILFLSDALLALMHGYAIVGSWSVFTYSGYLLIVLASVYLARQFTFMRAIFFAVGAELFFWIWTNFGVWMFSAMYAHTPVGLASTYIAALPFLHYALAGTLVWMGVLTLGMYGVSRRFVLSRV